MPGSDSSLAAAGCLAAMMLWVVVGSFYYQDLGNWRPIGLCCHCRLVQTLPVSAGDTGCVPCLFRVADMDTVPVVHQ